MPALTILASQPGWLRKAQFVSKLDATFLYDEIHLKRSYEQSGVRLTPANTVGGGSRVVLDIGANVGMFATRAAEALGSLEVRLHSSLIRHFSALLYRIYNDSLFRLQGAHVIAAEPLPATFQALQSNIAVHNSWCMSENIPCASVTALQVGVGDDSCLGTSASFTFYPKAAGWGTLTKFESPESIFSDMDAFINNALDDENSTALSLVQRKLGLALRKLSPVLYKSVSRAAVQQLMAAKTVVECPMTTVSEIIERHKVGKVILLKVDTERGEVDVLQGVREDHWGRIEQAALEVHEENLKLVLDILRLKGKFENVHTMQTADLKDTSIFMVFAYR